MLRHFFKVTIRNLIRHKVYTFINVTGFAVGMACCLLIALYVRHELSYDDYHINRDRIYRVLHAFRNLQGSELLPAPTAEEYQVWGNAPVGPLLKSSFPEIEKLVQFTSPIDLLLQNGDKRSQENNLLFMDSAAFDIFSWKMLSGNPRTALTAPNSIVLTESVAKKYFGSRDPVGLGLKANNNEILKVTGVIEDVPSNSHFNFNALISMSTFRKWNPEIFDYWGYVDFYTYFLLNKNANIASLQRRLPALIKQSAAKQEPGYVATFEPLTKAYLHSRATRQPGPVGSLSNIYMFLSIAAFILIIACINFMNLSTARSMERAKEVGVRKAVGAQHGMLIRQFLSESVLLSILAAIFAIAFTVLAIPAVSELSGKPLSSGALFSPTNLLLVLAASVLVGLLAGTYPAWVLSRFKSAQVLKGVFRKSPRGIILRKGLVVFQFALSTILIVGTGVVYTQLLYLKSKDLGFKQQQMMVIDFGGDDQVREKITLIKETLAAKPGVASVSASRAVMGEFLPNAGTSVQSVNGEMMQQTPLIYEVDEDFISHFGIQVVAGRGFSKDFLADTTRSLILNESGARLFGYSNPAEVIGKKFSQWGREGTVIGVVKNFNFRSLRLPVEPLSIRFAPTYSLNRLSVSLKSENLHATIEDIEKTWNQLAPQRPFLYHFLDESLTDQYQADKNFGQVFSLFSVLAIAIACLGLFGLATFTAEQRTKEVGIRKVLGASVFDILTLVSKDFIKLVLIAIVVASPVAWLVMNRWLDDFANRTRISPSIFLFAGLVAIVIAILTISWKSAKTAMANPVKSLRSE